MDYKEAIEILQTLYPFKCKMVDGRLKGGFRDYNCDTGKAITYAISAMQELQEYKQLGTLEEVQELVELRKEKRPQKVLGVFSVTEYECQNCGNTIPYLEDYCEWCGQKLDWTEVEE